jgi:hypothetical protein
MQYLNTFALIIKLLCISLLNKRVEQIEGCDDCSPHSN